VNRYLLKIAEMVQVKDKTLPYRRRVEVAIFKDGKVLLTKNKDKKTGDDWYGFPGGGTDGDSDKVAANKECLEEVGVQVANLKETDILHTQEGIGNKDGRDKKYRGSRTKMFVAEYSHKNTDKLGDDNDSVKYVWKTPEEAEPLLKDNAVNSMYRIKAMRQAKDLLKL
jgi:8-oxo-dGTP pyrophosphatase MutT (NUDIX family)